MKKIKGSLTIEAALILPIFLFGIMSILYLIEYVKIQTIVSGVIYNKSMYVGSYGYLVKELDNEKFYNLTSKSKDITSKLYFEKCVENELRKNKADTLLLDGKVDLSNSKLLQDDGYLKFDVRYKLKTPFSYLGIKNISIKKNIITHSWIGYENDFNKKDDYYVYITPSGTAYHITPTCSYIHISASSKSASEIESLRNASGSKYYSCKKCVGKQVTKGLVYITLYGSRYHADKNCSEINREVKKVKLSEVGGRHVCSKCKK